MTVRIIILSLALALFFNTGILLKAEQTLKPIEEIRFSENAEVPQTVLDFCVTDDGLVILPDTLGGKLLVYEINGNKLELIKEIGQKGFGPDGLVKPVLCHYSRDDSRLVVWDAILNKIIIYDRVGRLGFERQYGSEIFCRGAFDLKLSSSKLYVSGFAADSNNRPFDLYYFDLDRKTDDSRFEKVLLMPSRYKYGLDQITDSSKYQEQVEKKEKMKRLAGGYGFFDLHGDIAYYAWEANFRLIRINTTNGNVLNKENEENDGFNFNSVEVSKKNLPRYSEKLDNAYRRKDFKTIESERRKMAFIRDVFSNRDFVFTVIEVPNDSGLSKLFMQSFTHKGVFSGNALLGEKPSRLMFFSKSNSLLYSVNGTTNTDGYFSPTGIFKYKLKLMDVNGSGR